MAEYIDKKAVTKFIDDCLLREEKIQSVEKETLLAVKRWIDAIPAADVRPVVRGRWIPRDLTYGGDYYVCSVCERAVDVPMAMWVPLFRFCPHCGSDMEDDAE